MRQRGRQAFLFTKVTVAIVLYSLIFLFAKKCLHRGIRSNSIQYPLTEIAPRLSPSAEAYVRPTTQAPIALQGATLKPIQRFHRPENHPDPAIGLLRYRDEESCTTYVSRYESYEDASLNIAYLNSYPRYSDDDREKLDWSERQAREDKFVEELTRLNSAADRADYVDWGDEIIHRRRNDGKQANKAFIVRVQQNYTWGRDDISNVRALVAELALRPSVEESRDVFLMVEIWSPNVSFTMSDRQRQRVLASSVPREFWSIAHFTSEEERAALYPDLILTRGLKSRQSAVDLYRSCFMSLQIFSRQHRQYEYIWTWDMDVRSTADYNNVISDIERYAFKDSPNDPHLIRQQHWHIGGSSEERNVADDEEADLITLTPIMANVEDSGWYWASDFQNMPKDMPKRASIGRNVRFSRRLLDAMNEANVDDKISAHCESFPATILVAKQLQADDSRRWKGVYVPHPIYTLHDWPSEALGEHINRAEIYGIRRWNTRDLSFSYASSFAPRMYDKWRGDRAVCWAPLLVSEILRRL